MLSPAQQRGLYRKLGLRIQELRGDELTQEELADLVGLSRASIANLESGRQRVPLHHLFGIAEALHVPLADLLPEPAEFGLDATEADQTIEVVSDGGALSESARRVLKRVLNTQRKETQ